MLNQNFPMNSFLCCNDSVRIGTPGFSWRTALGKKMISFSCWHQACKNQWKTQQIHLRANLRSWPDLLWEQRAKKHVVEGHCCSPSKQLILPDLKKLNWHPKPPVSGSDPCSGSQATHFAHWFFARKKNGLFVQWHFSRPHPGMLQWQRA